jgi:hypothetical protein
MKTERISEDGRTAADGRIVFAAHFPNDLKSEIVVILEAWLPMLAPSWLHKIVLTWNPHENEDTGGKATPVWIVSDPEYRRAELCIAPLWLNERPAARRTNLIHELMHLPLEELDELFRRSNGEIEKKNPDLFQERREQWRRALEGAVCDLEATFAMFPDPMGDAHPR